MVSIATRRLTRAFLLAGTMAVTLSIVCCTIVMAQPTGAPPGAAPAAGNGPAAAPGGPPPDAQPLPAAPSPTGARSPSTWPPDPMPFQRGNVQPRAVGHYVSLFKLIPVIGLFLLWIHTAGWVSHDSRSLKVRSDLWTAIIYVAGLGAMFFALTVPSYPMAFILMLLAYGVPIGLYVNERNKRVPESGKVLTPKHLKGWALRQLSKVGIHIGHRAVQETAFGPTIRLIGKTKTGRIDNSRSKQVENSKGFLSAKEIVYDSILRRATDIHLEPKEEELGVRLRIDGVMYPTDPFEKSNGDAIVNIFKVLSAMDITERRRPQDGSFGAEMEDREIDFRVATQGTRFGEKMVIRILDQSNSVSSLAGLGMRKAMQEKIEEVISEPHGLFLCCGPTGAGKSTTLYACLNDIDHYERNIITIEDPVEYKMDGVTQIEINTKADQTFAGSLRSVLRQDPDVVMVGEIRDKETAVTACQAANTGHMVFSTVHANDSILALYRLLDLEVDPAMLAGSVSAILAQRLARRLCANCKEPYKPKTEVLKKLGLPPEKVSQFYRPPENGTNTCTTCGGLGYRGRVGVYELLAINERMRDMVRDKAPMSTLRAEARKDGMLYMKEEGLRLVVRGVTSLSEVQRVVK